MHEGQRLVEKPQIDGCGARGERSCSTHQAQVQEQRILAHDGCGTTVPVENFDPQDRDWETDTKPA